MLLDARTHVPKWTRATPVTLVTILVAVLCKRWQEHRAYVPMGSGAQALLLTTRTMSSKVLTVITIQEWMLMMTTTILLARIRTTTSLRSHTATLLTASAAKSTLASEAIKPTARSGISGQGRDGRVKASSHKAKLPRGLEASLQANNQANSQPGHVSSSSRSSSRTAHSHSRLLVMLGTLGRLAHGRKESKCLCKTTLVTGCQVLSLIATQAHGRKCLQLLNWMGTADHKLSTCHFTLTGSGGWPRTKTKTRDRLQCQWQSKHLPDRHHC